MTQVTTDAVLVRELVPGDMIDLEGDRFADPDRDHPSYEFEYALVAEIDVEKPDWTIVYFEGLSPVVFPADHRVPFGGHDDGYGK